METQQQQQQQTHHRQGQGQGRDIPVESRSGEPVLHLTGKEENEMKEEEQYTRLKEQQRHPVTSLQQGEETRKKSDVPVGEQIRSGDVKSKEDWSREQAQIEKDQPQYERVSEQPSSIKGTERVEGQVSEPVTDQLSHSKETEYGRGQGGGVLSELTPAQQEEHKQTMSRGESGSGSGGVSHHQASAMRVFDAAGGVVLSLTDDDVNHHNVGWLRQQLHQRIPATHLATGEPDVSEMHIFVHYGDWLADDVSLKSIHGDRMYVKCYRPHGNTSFNLNFKVVPSIESDRVLTVQVKDTDTIEQVKDRITELTRVPAIGQRIIFCDKELEDPRTITSYKLPAEATCELRLVPVE